MSLGTGTGDAAAGDHAHVQWHDLLTMLPSATTELSLAGQTLSAEVALASAGGLLATDLGVAVDFGTDAPQAAPGNYTHRTAAIDFGSGGMPGWASDWLNQCCGKVYRLTLPRAARLG